MSPRSWRMYITAPTDSAGLTLDRQHLGLQMQPQQRARATMFRARWQLPTGGALTTPL